MFLCCGDALFDLFSEPESDVSKISLAGHVGGSPLNVALGLSRLEHPVAYLTKMSGDVFGRRIRDFMTREGIGTNLLIATRRNTTLAVVSLSASGSATYDFYVEGTADRSIEIEDIPALPAEVEAIHVGSYSTVTEPTASALQHLIDQEAGRRFISYDPNIRPSIEPDLDLWRERVSRIVPKAGLIKASEEDLAMLYPDRSLSSVAEDWIAAGAGLAVVTRGENGALARCRSGAASEAAGLPVKVVDTVGAGDTFQAALLAKLKEDRLLSKDALGGLDEAALSGLLGFAVKAASVTCSRRGADLPRRADLGLA
ncbi:carbohydrate kinase family protein [Consotaella salsifontis]|uniref:Fructokinase n=1 Tax=Consotaella salsifontis TaxID=1365950 RepID=A0A1T4NN88_9HYPH|nr:carbohydrate kinase [Consotaella salsifontis]SJZ80516.1 fructokinase [Consotaella salsifontis]